MIGEKAVGIGSRQRITNIMKKKMNKDKAAVNRPARTYQRLQTISSFIFSFVSPFLVLYQLLIPWNLEAIDIFSKQFIVEGQWVRDLSICLEHKRKKINV